MSNASVKLEEARNKILDELKPLDEYAKFCEAFRERAEKGEFCIIDDVLERWREKLLLCHNLPGMYGLEILPPTGNPSAPMVVTFSRNKRWTYLEYVTLPQRSNCPAYRSDKLEDLLPSEADQKVLKEFRVNFGLHIKTTPVSSMLHQQLKADWVNLESAVVGKTDFLEMTSEDHDLNKINKELVLKTLESQANLKRAIASMRVTLGCIHRYMINKK